MSKETKSPVDSTYMQEATVVIADGESLRIRREAPVIVHTTYGGLRWLDGKLQQKVHELSERSITSEWCDVPCYMTVACPMCRQSRIVSQDSGGITLIMPDIALKACPDCDK